MPPLPAGPERIGAIQEVLADLTPQAEDPRWDPANRAFWAEFFVQRHARKLEDTGHNGPVIGRKNAGGRWQWWGALGHTLAYR